MKLAKFDIPELRDPADMQRWAKDLTVKLNEDRIRLERENGEMRKKLALLQNSVGNSVIMSGSTTTGGTPSGGESILHYALD